MAKKKVDRNGEYVYDGPSQPLFSLRPRLPTGASGGPFSIQNCNETATKTTFVRLASRKSLKIWSRRLGSNQRPAVYETDS